MNTLALYTTVVFTTLSILVVGMSFLRSKNHFPVNERTVIVTGGSQGLGLSIAQKLASKGANVVIVARDSTKLEKAIAEIKSHAVRSSQRFLHLSFDLRSPESATKILEQVTSWNNGTPPDVVWNCAGYAVPAFFADASIETLRDQFDTVFWSAAYMAHATLAAWTKPRSDRKSPSISPRHLVFTSSTLVFFPLAGYSPYTPPKAAMRALVDGLRQEVAVYNGAYARNDAESPEAEIKLGIIFPMGIDSPGFEQENKVKPAVTRKLEEDDVPQQPSLVADVAIKSLEKGEHTITTMALGHLMKGCGMGSSPRTGISDVFWNWLGSVAIIVVGPLFMSKCKAWGKEKGIRTA